LEVNIDFYTEPMLTYNIDFYRKLMLMYKLTSILYKNRCELSTFIYIFFGVILNI